MSLSRLRWCFALSVVCSAIGCANGQLMGFGNQSPKATLRNPVVQMLALWQPGDGIGLDDKSSRGFSGQVYFFTQNKDFPAIVDGTVRVYVFDNQGTEEEQGKPLHQFEFPPEAWDTHRFDSKLGTVYNVFVPYPRKGGHEAECTLQVRFTPRSGPTVYTEMTKIVLPGMKQSKKNQDASETGSANSTEEVVQREVEQSLTKLAQKANVETSKPAKKTLQVTNGTNADSATAGTRPQPVPLTDEEQSRILAETKLQRNSGVVHATHAEPARQRSWDDERIVVPSRKLNPVKANVAGDEGTPASAPKPLKPASGRHPLSDDNANSQEPETGSRPTKGSTKQASTGDAEPHKHMEAHTIPLPGRISLIAVK